MRQILRLLISLTLAILALPTSKAEMPPIPTNRDIAMVHHEPTNPFLPHDHTASLFAGGVVSAWYDHKDKSASIHLHPEFGFFLNKDWAIGVMLGYGMHQHDGATAHHFRVSPFLRYYYLHRGPFNLYLDGGVGYNYKKAKGGEGSSGFEVGIRPGACVDLTEGLCLCLRLGFVGYRDNFFSGEEPGVPLNGFGIHFAPEELMIGLEIEF